MSDVYKTYRDKLAKLQKQLAAINAKVAPLQEKLDKQNLAAEEARLAAEALAKEISDLRGGQSYLDLKKEIAALSTMLSGKFKE